MQANPRAPAARAQPLYRALYFQVVVAIVLGVLLGHYLPDTGAALKPLGDGFIKLIKMIIAPVIFCTVVTGIAGMEDMKRVGRTGGVALLYFEVVSTLALMIGLLVVNLVQPGAGMNAVPSAIDTKGIAAYTLPGKMGSATDFVMNIIPSTVIDAFAKGEMLQVLLVALLFGFALHRCGGRNTLVFEFIDKTSQVLFGIVGIVMKLAPIGAFGAMAFTIGKYGVGALMPLLKLMGSYYLTCILFIVVVLGAIARANGFSIFKLVRYFKEELLIVLGTASSEAVLPRLLDKMERLGAHKSVVGLVVPTGYSFNLDGTSIYLSMAAIFIAQATNTDLSLGQQVTLLLVLMLTSKGAAAFTGSAFVVLAGSLSAIGHVPIEGLALIVGINRFMTEAGAVTNLLGNGVATLAIARWNGALDEGRLQRQLDQLPEPDQAPVPAVMARTGT
jgi:aerobic C4-dicarboxylate transport protein